jgi:thiol-disulfide isomerase/thioredoxin
MTLHELQSASAVYDFKSTNTNALICFSATWCGPCKASKPAYEDLAKSYLADPLVDVKCAIVYEHNLAEAIHDFQIQAFPTYVLFVNHGKEYGRIQGVNFDGIRELIHRAGCHVDLGKGNTLGGGVLSSQEARKQRLAVFEKNKSHNEDEDVMEQEKASAGEEDIVKDVEMKDLGDEDRHEHEDEDEMVDPTENLSKEDILTLTESMGFTLIRAQKALLNSSSGIEGAIEWLTAHQDDEDIDDPIPKVPKSSSDGSTGLVAQSYKCNECGKILSNMANLELHANKTGHSDFEESTQAAKQLTEEEKLQKIAEIKSLLKAKRMEREALEKVEDIDREKKRREMGKNMAKTKEELERQTRMREAMLKKKEKEDFRKERARIKAELERDRLERKAHHGKLSSKLGIEGYNPDAIQYDVSAESGAHVDHHPDKKIKASVSKIDEYIAKVSSYKAGGDGGMCLKILIAYIKNIVDNPNEQKFRKINMENKAYKTKVKPFVGAKALLLAVGFHPNEGNDALVLEDDANMDVLKQAKDKLEAAHAAY